MRGKGGRLQTADHRLQTDGGRGLGSARSEVSWLGTSWVPSMKSFQMSLLGPYISLFTCNVVIPLVSITFTLYHFKPI